MGKANTGEVISGVYKITNNINHKFYIGQSVDIKYRFYEHTINAGKDHNSAIDAAIQKYGKDNFMLEILEECDESMLLERERYWAEEVFNNACYAPLGYNISRTGVGGCRINMVAKYSLSGEIIALYISAKDAGRKHGVSGAAIARAIRNKGTCCGFQWRYGDEPLIEEYKPGKTGIGIDCYNSKGELVMSFQNGPEAAKYFGITNVAINSYVNHKSGYVRCSGYYLAKSGESPVIRDNIKIRKIGDPCFEYDVNSRRLIKRHLCVKDASEGRDSKSIRNALNGIQNNAYGSIWSYKEYDVIPENYREINKAIYQSRISS